MRGGSPLHQCFGQRLRVGHDLPGVVFEAGSAASRKQIGLGGDDVPERPPCMPGKTVLSRALACGSVQSTNPERGPRSVLCDVDVTKSATGTGLL